MSSIKYQQVLLPELKERVIHGGELWLGRRKSARPIATKKPMHVVLRSSHAKGSWSFLAKPHAEFLRHLVPDTAKRCDVSVYEWANSGNHLHLLIRARPRVGFKRFLMILSGGIAQKITGARKGKSLGKRFFDFIPYTRIVVWGRAFAIAKRYVLRNTLEAQGLIPYQSRTRGRASG